MDGELFFQVLGGAAMFGVIAGGAAISWSMARRAVDDVRSRWVQVQEERLGLRRQEMMLQYDTMRHRVAVLDRDEWGRAGIAYDGRVFRDLDTRAAFTQDLNLALEPVLEQLQVLLEVERARARAMPPSHYHYENVVSNELAAGAEAAEAEAGKVELRKHITLAELTKLYGAGSYHRLLLGETVDEKGGYVPVFGDLTDMVHVLISGATKWGKSTLQEALAKELVLSRDCDLAFVDLGCNTFGAFVPYALYPIAETPDLVVALFRALCQEMESRRQKMSQYPLAKTLEQYNKASGDNLRPIVCFVDEASVLFDKSSDAQELATDLTRMGRKYALGCSLGGTDFRAETLPTSARGNCGARFAFHFEEVGLSRSIIRSAEAVNLRNPGRALARLPGVAGLTELQCPIVDRWDDLPKATGRTIDLQPVRVESSEPERSNVTVTADQVKQVIEMHAAGESDTAIAGALWHNNPYYLKRVRGILAEHDNNNNNDGENDPADPTLDSELEGDNVVVVPDGVDFCDFCGRDGDSMPAEVEISTCPRCGVAVCSDCQADGLCPDCEGQ